MHISIKHFEGKYPSFNVSLHSKEGEEEFLTIKGCRIVSGAKGEFVSWPATKKDDGKYWNHVYASEAFAAAVMKKVKQSAPKPPAQSSGGFDGFEDDIPW